MTGGFALIVGPSGAGKDTLIGLAKIALARDERFVFPRRLITRPTSPWEDHDTLDRAAFEHAEEAGRFCLSWRAHGLCYGIPAGAHEAARRGRIAVCNVSRKVVEDARRRLSDVRVVEVTAPVDALAQRVAARGREDAEDLRQRLLQSRVVDVRADLTIVNIRTPGEGTTMLVSFLHDWAGADEQSNKLEVGAFP